MSKTLEDIFYAEICLNNCYDSRMQFETKQINEKELIESIFYELDMISKKLKDAENRLKDFVDKI